MGKRRFFEYGFTKAVWIGISWDIGRTSFSGKQRLYEINILLPFLILSFSYESGEEY